MFAGVAQLVEHLLAKEKVAGSNPVSRSTHPSVNDWWVFLLPKISACLHLRENLPRWRTGVILEFEGNRALVKADVQDKKVLISVAGSGDGRRRLLTLIRIEFDSIHRAIRNLQPQEMVPLPEHPDVVVPYRKLLVMEEKGVNRFTEVVGDDVIDLDVRELLNGVDLAEHVEGSER